MTRKPVKELQEGMAIPLQTFLLGEVALAETKNGKTYARCKLGDKTGIIEGVYWDYGSADQTVQALFVSGKLIDISGVVDVYKDKPQFKISGVAPARTADMREFEKSSAYDPHEMWDEFLSYVKGFENSIIRELASRIVDSYGADFRTKPAATGMHHAFKSGLLEHTLQMLKTGDKLFELPFYANELNKDLCLFGLMFHDFGKIFEYGDGPGFAKTMSGIKVPHIPKMAAIIYKIGCDLGIPDDLSDELMSIVLSHHRFLAWGSPVAPSSPEALFVHYIDNLHGDVFGVLQRIQDDTSSDAKVKHGFGAEAYTITKKRFSTLLKELEEQHGRVTGEHQKTSAAEGQESTVDGF